MFSDLSIDHKMVDAPSKQIDVEKDVFSISESLFVSFEHYLTNRLRGGTHNDYYKTKREN